MSGLLGSCLYQLILYLVPEHLEACKWCTRISENPVVHVGTCTKPTVSIWHTHLEHAEKFSGGGGASGKAGLKFSKVHEFAELLPEVVMIQHHGQGDTLEMVQVTKITLLFDAHSFHLGTQFT